VPVGDSGSAGAGNGLDKVVRLKLITLLDVLLILNALVVDRMFEK
jgi:hypothetical protein